MKRLCLLLLLLLTVLPLAARDFPYAYIPLSLEDGLSQPNVTALLTDRRGTLWIGTRNGLNRYDRQEIRTYASRSGDLSTLPDNLVLGLCEDAEGSIWVRTGRGLSRFLPQEDVFERMMDTPVYSSAVAGERVLFGGDGLLYAFGPGREEPERLFPFGEAAAGNFRNRIVRILPLEEGAFLLGTEFSGLYRYVPGQQTRLFAQGPDQALVNLYRCASGEILAAFYGDGYRSYHADGRETGWYTTRNSALTNDYVQDFAEFDGGLWIATDGGGICIRSSSDGLFHALVHTSGNPESLPSNSVTVLYPEASGTLWAGTVKHGFFQVRRNYIRSFAGHLYGLTDNAVTSLYREPDGRLWVGTDGGGLHAFDPVAGRFSLLPGTKGKILSIAGFDRDRLLESVYMEGFFLVDKRSGRKTPFLLVDEQVNRRECFRGYLPRVGQVEPDKLYFLSASAWVYRISDGTFRPMEAADSSLLVDNLRMACSDSLRSYFYRENRVLYADKADDQLRLLVQVGEGETVTAVACDGEGMVWVGTDRGLGRFDPESGTYNPVRTPLLDSGVSALEAEPGGRLWICSRNQLVTYLIGEDRFIPWSASDGFRPNDIKMLFQNAADPDFLYLGGSGGLVQVDRNIPVTGSDTPVLFLDKLYVNGSSALSRMDGKRIRVPWDYQSLAASFLVKDDDLFRRTLFRYTVEGAQSRTFESYDPMLTLPTLSPGTYEVGISCLTKGGHFTEPAFLLEVTVLPPWYRSVWFHVVACLLLLAALLWLQLHLRRRQEHESKSSMAMFLEGMLQEPDAAGDEADAAPEASDPEFRSRLDAAILDNLSNPDLDVQFLTERLAMSRTTLYEKVKQETGMGVKDYINRLRIERSVDLLLHTDKNINEISYEVGFSYPRYFSTSFKNMKGVTPTRFKQENRPVK